MDASKQNRDSPRGPTEALRSLVEGRALDRASARSMMEGVLRGEATDAQIAALLTVLRLRGETVEELVGFASAMRAHTQPLFDAAPPPGPLVDTCGTGGASVGAFNISTAAAFVVAAAGGVRVAKHGNRALSSRCGSADVLEALGVNLEAPLERVAAAIRELGIGFLFAPSLHTATRHAQKVRRELGFRTVFNLLGPLTNPAPLDAQVVGVYDARWLEPVARTLGELGVKRAFVVHSHDGLDEVSPAAPTDVAELRDAAVETYSLAPEDFGLPRASLESIRGGNVGTNAEILQKLFAGERGPRRDVVLMNAALALVAAGRAGGLREGVALGEQALDSGAAGKLLRALVEFTQDSGKERGAS